MIKNINKLNGNYSYHLLSNEQLIELVLLISDYLHNEKEILNSKW